MRTTYQEKRSFLKRVNEPQTVISQLKYVSTLELSSNNFRGNLSHPRRLLFIHIRFC